MHLTIRYPLLPKAKSLGTSLVMDAFGIGMDTGDHVVCENLELKLEPAQRVLFSGPSGSGKSSLLQAVVNELRTDEQHTLIDIHELPLPQQPLVDALPLSVKAGLDLLATCGLSEAQLLLRTPSELSEGQRYRFRLALGLALLQQRPPHTYGWLIADEFTATLDRTLAQVLAYNLSKLAARQQIGCLLATTHNDVAADLAPDVLVQPDLDGIIHVDYVEKQPGRRRISFFPPVSSGRAPVLTGPTSPVGTIAATRSASSNASPSSGTAHAPSASASLLHPLVPCGFATNTSASPDAAVRSLSRS